MFGLEREHFLIARRRLAREFVGRQLEITAFDGVHTSKSIVNVSVVQPKLLIISNTFST